MPEEISAAAQNPWSCCVPDHFLERLRCVLQDEVKKPQKLKNGARKG